MSAEANKSCPFGTAEEPTKPSLAVTSKFHTSDDQSKYLFDSNTPVIHAKKHYMSGNYAMTNRRPYEPLSVDHDSEVTHVTHTHTHPSHWNISGVALLHC